MVQIEVPERRLDAVFRTYFRSFVHIDAHIWAREDEFDVGPGYRAVLGFPGGIGNTAVMAELRKENVHNMTFRAGHGSDADTFGTNTVFILDSMTHPFFQAELCLQFHNNQTGQYTPSYHALKAVLMKEGRLVNTSCPANYVCGG